MQVLGRLPAQAHALLGQTLSLPNMLSNLIVTNVPGPLAPLYLMGHRLVEHYPWVPLGWRMGLSVALMSYDRAIWFGFTADRDTPGDIDALAGYLAACHRELREAAGVPAAVPGFLTADTVAPELRLSARRAIMTAGRSG